MKKTFLLLALVCVLVLLAACSSKPTPTEPAPTDAAPTEQAPTEQAPTEQTPTEPASTEPAASRDLQMLYQSGITAMGADAPVLFPVSDISELSPLFPGLEEISFRQVSGGLSPVTGARAEELKVLLEAHARLTGSPKAASLLSRWEKALSAFKMVIPTEYKRAMGGR